MLRVEVAPERSVLDTSRVFLRASPHGFRPPLRCSFDFFCDFEEI